MHVIVTTAYGDVEACDATVANAKRILSWQTIPTDALSFDQNRPAKYTTYEKITAMVNKILKAPEGTIVMRSPDINDMTPIIVATCEAKQEIIMYCFNHKIDPNSISSYNMKCRPAHNELQCLSYFREMTVVDEWVVEAANKYSIITNDKWQDGVTDIRKIEYILDFINEWSNRDVRYQLVTVKPTC